MPLRIALTGGIGSGKTYVADLFAEQGVPVYKADNEAKRLLNEDDALRRQVIQPLDRNATAREVSIEVTLQAWYLTMQPI